MEIALLDKMNIENLTELWKEMGVQSHTSLPVKGLNISAGWPNRYWFGWDTDKSMLSVIDDLLPGFPSHGIIPVWEVTESAILLQQKLVETGFEMLFSQTAMYLDLEAQLSAELPPIKINSVYLKQDIETWTKIASEAFAYEVDVAVIHHLANHADSRLLLAYSGGKAAATALLFKTAGIIGVHLVGVPQGYRGAGLASSLIQHVIAQSKDWGGKYLTLQASQAGEGIYRRIGFKPQFNIKNYQKRCPKTG